MAVFLIGGVSTAGKTTLSQRLADKHGLARLGLDDEWVKWCDDPDPVIRRARMYLVSLGDPDEHWRKTCQERWDIHVGLCTTFWPRFKELLLAAKSSGTRRVAEGVWVLPRHAAEIEIPSLFLLSPSAEQTYAELKKKPRWRSEEKFLEKEAADIHSCMTPHFRDEAEFHGFSTVAGLAEAEALCETTIVRL